MGSYTALIPVVGTVLASMIAAAIAFIVSVLTKESKVSDFRQAWIDALRSDVAELLSTFNILEGVYDVTVKRLGVTQSRQDDFWVEHHDSYMKIQNLCNRVILRLNAKEHAELISDFKRLESSVGEGQEGAALLHDEIIVKMSMLFKTEWEKVKSGESLFKWMKRITATIAITGFAVSLGLAIYYLFLAKT